MSVPNIIAIGILLVAIIAILGIRLYTLRKNNDVTFDQFISLYGNQIIEVLKDVIDILQIRIEDFEDKESYEKAIISTTVDIIKENSEKFGIDSTIIDLFDTESLTEIVYNIFTKASVEIFSVVDSNSITKNSNLYEDEVVVALSAAK